MKIIAVVVVAVLMSTFAYAQKIQEKDVPAAVKTKFKSMFSTTKVEKWEKEDGRYEAGFKNGGTETSVVFDASGSYIQKEVEILVASLPKAVKEYVKTSLAAKKIEEATKIVSASGTVSYEVEIGKSDYLFDANGKYVSKEADDTETDDDK